MANGLRAKLSKLRHDGHITDVEYKSFIKKDGWHDAEIRAKAIEEFASKMKWEYENSTGVPKKEIEFAKAVIDMVAERMKGGAE